MKELVVKKSAWGVVNFWSIVLCILIIPIFVLVYRIIRIKQERITFYNDKVVVEKGLLNKSKKTFAFTGVFRVDINQSLIGRMFNYANLEVDFAGKTDIDTNYVSNPKEVVAYLENKMIKKNNVTTHVF